MTIWIDAHLPPALASWISEHFQIETRAVRDLSFRHAKDVVIHSAARAADVVIMTKDDDFVRLLEQFGPPPQVLWITCGNTSNARLRTILRDALPHALRSFEQGENLVEISDAR